MSSFALISGLSGGIGSALARRLHSRGWRVGGLARNQAPLASLAAELPGLLTSCADATDPDALERAFGELCAQAGGPPDAYVHCVGSILLKPAHLTSLDEWRRTLAVNLDSAFFGLRLAAGAMQTRGSGAIVLLSSVAASAGLPNHEAISAAKAGIEGLARAAAATYAARGVRVNVVAPGLTDTPLSASLLAGAQARSISERLHPLGRVGLPADIAAALEYLVSPDSSWITGQVWHVDGGLSTVRPRPRA